MDGSLRTHWILPGDATSPLLNEGFRFKQQTSREWMRTIAIWRERGITKRLQTVDATLCLQRAKPYLPKERHAQLQLAGSPQRAEN